jgi:hypothetical protein
MTVTPPVQDQGALSYSRFPEGVDFVGDGDVSFKVDMPVDDDGYLGVC